MNRITLKPNGVLEVKGASIASKPLLYLGCGLQLAVGCTLRSYFHMLNTYPLLAQLGDFFEMLARQYDQCPAGDCVLSDFDCLEFSKTIEMSGFPGEPRLDVYNALRGIKGAVAEDIRSVSLARLLDMPLRLGCLRHIIFGDRMDAFEFETIYTLFEFIDGLAWELSFHGVPPECQLRS